MTPDSHESAFAGQGRAGDSYAQALEFLRTRTNYEQIDRRGAAFGLEPMRRLLDALGHPERGIRCIHVAGSKGKGSVAWMLAAFLRRAGLRTGRYLSPHLLRIEERIAVDGAELAPREFGDAVLEAASVSGSQATAGANATFFDVLTAAAWVAFARAKTEIVVLETGLGGRLDSTNATDEKLACVLTAMGLEHTEILGSDIARIAEEKARIARRGVPIFSSSAAESPEGRAVARVAAEVGAPLMVAGREFRWRNPRESGGGLLVDVETIRRSYLDIRLPTQARYQLPNLALAVAVLDDLEARGVVRDARAAVERPPEPGAGDLRIPGRFDVREIGGVTHVFDGAHTRESIEALLESLDAAFPGRRRFVVFGASVDKDLARLSSALANRVDLVFATRARTPRAADPGLVFESLRSAGVEAHSSPEMLEALRSAQREAAQASARPGSGAGIVIVTGSLYLIGDALAAIGAARTHQ
jgi:dihydrofolate synthase/folylpolyglutamate synthase